MYRVDGRREGTKEKDETRVRGRITLVEEKKTHWGGGEEFYSGVLLGARSESDTSARKVFFLFFLSQLLLPTFSCCL